MALIKHVRYERQKDHGSRRPCQCGPCSSMSRRTPTSHAINTSSLPKKLHIHNSTLHLPYIQCHLELTNGTARWYNPNWLQRIGDDRNRMKEEPYSAILRQAVLIFLWENGLFFRFGVMLWRCCYYFPLTKAPSDIFFLFFPVSVG